jgi:ankyrin repeat protein
VRARSSAANNAVESVMLLLEHGASIEAKDNDGYTALHHSAFNNSVEVLQRLLKAGTCNYTHSILCIS